MTTPVPPPPPRRNDAGELHRRLHELAASLSNRTCELAEAIRAERERDRLEENLRGLYQGPALAIEEIAEAIAEHCEDPRLTQEELAEWVRNIR